MSHFCYAECRCTEYRVTEYRYTQFRYAQCHYAEGHYTECRHSECRGTIKAIVCWQKFEQNIFFPFFSQPLKRYIMPSEREQNRITRVSKKIMKRVRQQMTWNNGTLRICIHMIFSFFNDKVPLAPKYSGASSLEVLCPSIILIRFFNRMLHPLIFLIHFSDRISLSFSLYRLAFQILINTYELDFVVSTSFTIYLNRQSYKAKKKMELIR